MAHQDFPLPDMWPRVERGIRSIDDRLKSASNEEEFQAVGLLCRETLISLAQAVYDAENHPPVDGTVPSQTDAKRMLEAYIAVELRGGTNEAARRHARASLDLANDLQHRRTATFRDAALCAEATSAVVNLIKIVSGRRQAPRKQPTPSASKNLNVPPGYERRLKALEFQIGREAAARNPDGSYSFPVHLEGSQDALRSFLSLATHRCAIPPVDVRSEDGICHVEFDYAGSCAPDALRDLARQQNLKVLRCGVMVKVNLP